MAKLIKPSTLPEGYFYAFFSSRSAEKYGYAVYLTAENKELNCTEVGSDSDPLSYRWGDVEFVGLVKGNGFVRSFVGTATVLRKQM